MELKKAYFPGKYIQAAGAIQELPQLIESYGGKSLLLVTRSMVEQVKKLAFLQPQEMEVFSAECCWEELNRLEALARAKELTVVVGVGGGKLVDSAKIVADKLQLPVIMVPTVAATNAACSACAVIYTKEGVELEVYYQKNSPDVLLVDTQIIAEAPVRFLVSGMGDALATWFEARACYKNQAHSCVDALQTEIAMLIAEATYRNLLEYGELAALACKNQVVTPALETIVETNLLFSGIGFESGGLASAHAIHNGLTIFPETQGYSHGEKVAFGVLAELHLTNADPEEILATYEFCEAVGLPTTLRELGLKEKTKEELLEAARVACLDDYMLHDGANITPAQVYAAMVAADSMGRLRKEK